MLELTYTNICVGSFLLIGSVLDLKKREVSLWMAGIYGLLGVHGCIRYQEQTLVSIFGGVIVGLFLIGLAFLSEEAIGFGDGMVMVVTGLYLGFWQNLELCMTGLILSAAFSGILIIAGIAKKNQAIPFLPFLMLGYIGMVIL